MPDPDRAIGSADRTHAPPEGPDDERVFVGPSLRTTVLIKRGAEAELHRTEFLGRPAVDKTRTPKAYRQAELDESLRRARIRTETRLMADARAAGVSVPILYDIDLAEAKVVMEFIDGPTMKEVLDRGGPTALKAARDMGRVVGRLHRAGIVHGDLTTSNMILRAGRIVMIDFSLGAKDKAREARGVDLHLLREGLVSAHARATTYYREVVRGYRQIMGRDADAVIATVKEIESRGRYT
jgi:Kae1-associated kinase Bud32